MLPSTLRGAQGDQRRPSAPPEPAQCEEVTRLPRTTKVDVPLAPRLPRKGAAATRASPVLGLPRLPRKTKVDAKCYGCHVKTNVYVARYHACHAKRRGAQSDLEPAQCDEVPLLPQNEGGCPAGATPATPKQFFSSRLAVIALWHGPDA